MAEQNPNQALSNNLIDLSKAVKNNSHVVGEAAQAFNLWNQVLPALNTLNKSTLAVGVTYQREGRALHKSLMQTGLTFQQAASEAVQAINAGFFEFRKASQLNSRFTSEQTQTLGKTVKTLAQLDKDVAGLVRATK